ncbi:MAG: glutamine--fructose-6-phosphate transaminase (isomerizing), partial [Candidatus Wildermuthbacteria bacterium]|nr:glutamine--fructose-6-phosphate transaminase (isomerizing) [Candidatus Wildermuthbacteria bacterium]
MCGIIGYIGKQQAAPILLEGLRRESYRGYDSSGIVVFGNPSATLARAVGKLEVLEQKLAGNMPDGTIGVGHCLAPNTLIQMADGSVKQIANIQDGESVITFDTDAFKLSTGEVKAWKHRSPLYLREIRTPSGTVKATEEHRMFVWTEHGAAEKKVKDIVPGDLLIVPKHIAVQEGKNIPFESVATRTYYQLQPQVNASIKQRIKSLDISIPSLAEQTGVAVYDLAHMVTNDRNVRTDVLERVMPVLSLRFPSEGFIPKHSIHGNFVTLPKTSSPELMQIIGYFLGDGCARTRTLRFKDPRRDVLQRYQTLFTGVFNLSGRIGTMSDTSAYLLEINSTSLADWFHKNVIARKEQLLEKIGGLPKKEIASFARGLFDAEGSVGNEGHQISLVMTNELIVRTLYLLLLQFGITSSISSAVGNRPSHWKRPYKLAISSRDSIQRFLDSIGFSSKEKQEKGRRLVPLMVRNASISFKILPYSKNTLYQKCVSFASKSQLRKFFRPSKHFNHFIRESTLRNFIVYLKKEHAHAGHFVIKELESFLQGDILFQSVLSNQKQKTTHPYVYDLEVATHNNFFANGLLSHNSRWATHGGVTEENAHPHADCKGNIYVAHNGIIENYRAIKEKLIERGHRFISQTDTEVLPHLIEHLFKGNLEDAVRQALQYVKGTYGLVAIAKEDPGKIVAARMSSPLVLSVNGHGGFVASDPAALISHSNRMVFLEDREVAVITENDFFVTDLKNNQKEKTVTELDWTVEEAQKSGYAHFMLKEIMEQPDTIQNAIRGRLLLREGTAKLGGLDAIAERLRTIERFNIVACGTAYYAGMVAKYMFEELAGIPAEVDIASEFRYRNPIISPTTASLFISQSGETADTLAALGEVKRKGCLTLGIVNVVGSTLSREIDAGVYNYAGPEVGVASTKALTSQLSVLALFTLFLGRQRGMSVATGQRIAQAINQLPELVQKVLHNAPAIRQLAQTYSYASDFLYIGRKYQYPIALEG